MKTVHLEKFGAYIHVHVFNMYFLPCCQCSVDVGSGEDKAYLSLKLAELQRVGTLGMGGFGRVELVGCKDMYMCACKL